MQCQEVYDILSTASRSQLIQINFDYKNPIYSTNQINVRVFFNPQSTNKLLQLILRTKNKSLTLDYGFYKNNNGIICINPFIPNNIWDDVRPYIFNYKTKSIDEFISTLMNKIKAIDDWGLNDVELGLEELQQLRRSTYNNDDDTLKIYFTGLTRKNMSQTREEKCRLLFGDDITNYVKNNGYTIRLSDNPNDEKQLIISQYIEDYFK